MQRTTWLYRSLAQRFGGKGLTTVAHKTSQTQKGKKRMINDRATQIGVPKEFEQRTKTTTVQPDHRTLRKEQK